MSRVAAAEAVLRRFEPREATLSLRELRQQRDMTLRQVEADTGFNRGLISEIENGKRVPTPVHLLALSDLYGVPPEGWQLVIEYRIPKEVAA